VKIKKGDAGMKRPKGRLNRIEHVLILEELGQELDSAGLHCPNAHPDIPMARDEDHRQIDAYSRELVLFARNRESYAVRANPILGGLHHEYSLALAAA
jgi:hypothetical protein